MKTTKIRQSARGQPCQVRIPNCCNHNPETTVLAHLKVVGMHGTGLKPPDIFGAWCCSSCHDVIDGRSQTIYSKEQVKLWAYEGMVRTLNRLLDLGLINIK